MAKEPKRSVIQVRVSARDWARVRGAAKLENRSVSGWLRNIVLRGLDVAETPRQGRHGINPPRDGRNPREAQGTRDGS